MGDFGAGVGSENAAPDLLPVGGVLHPVPQPLRVVLQPILLVYSPGNWFPTSLSGDGEAEDGEGEEGGDEEKHDREVEP